MDDASQQDFERRLKAAEGYIELGMYLDANAELEEIEEERGHQTPVLVLRLRIYRALEKWDLMLSVAKSMALRDPQNAAWALAWATATRRAVSLDAARLVLLEAVERMPAAATIHYNLACYECQLGDVEVARARLKHAFMLDETLKAKARADPDLAPVWEA